MVRVVMVEQQLHYSKKRGSPLVQLFGQRAGVGEGRPEEAMRALVAELIKSSHRGGVAAQLDGYLTKGEYWRQLLLPDCSLSRAPAGLPLDSGKSGGNRDLSADALTFCLRMFMPLASCG
jgi:hypothetical protein